MVASLEQSGAVKSPEVRRAFEEVARETFVGEIAAREGLASVYRPDAVLVTAVDSRGFSISASSATAIMAPMLEELELVEGMRVLEIGTGTGYNAALLRRLVGSSGTVVSIDVDADLVHRARSAWRQSGHRCRGIVGDGRQGWASGGPYDRIIVTASSADVPVAWRNQLREGGLLELPLRMTDAHLPQKIVTFRRDGHLLRSVSTIPGFFMRLRGAEVPDAPGSATMVARVVSSELSVTSLATLEGTRLTRLSHQARRRLLGLLLQKPSRRLQTINGERVQGLVDFLHLSRIRGLVAYATGDGHGVALIERGGAAVAAVLCRPGSQPGMIVTWGDDVTATALLDGLRRWRELGSPAARDLRLTVGFSHRVPGRHWRTLRRGDCAIAMDWNGAEPVCSPAPGGDGTARPTR
jgi:protein-L-isoaspartate(D-aspartate) O-methyltransferase